MRRLTFLFCAILAAAGCARHPEGAPSALATGPSPTAASLLGSAPIAPGGMAGKFDIAFPGRSDSLDFRNQLETKYATDLGRSAAPTFVDREGEVVWTQEYLRYRANGCDHAIATQRVLAQIDGQKPGDVCGLASDGAVTFPPRTETFDFRRQLESKYQQSGRGASLSAVDAEGGVIWTQEYLRYRVNACDHATSVRNVFAQVDGGPVTVTCFPPPCVFSTSPAFKAVPASGGTFTTTVTRSAGDCSFVAETVDPYVSIDSGNTGAGATTTLTYTVRPNFLAARSTFIRLRWAGNSTAFDINQAAGDIASFTLTDPQNAAGVTTTTCLIKSALTPCTFNIVGARFSANATYRWSVTYDNGGTVKHDVITTDPTFTFTQSCSGPTATTTGTQVPLNVILVITDGEISITRQTTFGSQLPLFITFFKC